MGIEKAFYGCETPRKSRVKKIPPQGKNKIFLGLEAPKSQAKFFSFLGSNGTQYYTGISQELASKK